jgi:hypothetical protein
MITSRLPTVATHGDVHSTDDDKAVKHVLNTDLKTNFNSDSVYVSPESDSSGANTTFLLVVVTKASKSSRLISSMAPVRTVVRDSYRHTERLSPFLP